MKNHFFQEPFFQDVQKPSKITLYEIAIGIVVLFLIAVAVIFMVDITMRLQLLLFGIATFVWAMAMVSLIIIRVCKSRKAKRKNNPVIELKPPVVVVDKRDKKHYNNATGVKCNGIITKQI